MIKYFYRTHIWDPNRYYNSGLEGTWAQSLGLGFSISSPNSWTKALPPNNFALYPGHLFWEWGLIPLQRCTSVYSTVSAN